MKAVRLIPAAAAIAAMMLCLALPIADLSSAEVDNDQGTVTYYTYTVDFQFQGTDAQWILWDFGFEENGEPVTSDEWNPSGIVFPAKGTYTVTQTVGNTVGTYVSQLKINIMGTPEVSFDSNGGSEVPMQIVKVGNKAVQPDNPVKDGYVFQGWYREQSLLNRYDFDQPVSQHITLYAKWSMAPHDPADPTVPDGDDGNGGGDTDTEGKMADEESFSPDIVNIALIVIGGIVAAVGYRNGSRGILIAGAIAAVIGIVCWMGGFDVFGFTGGGSS